MSEPFIGEIKMFGGNFAPRGYALCQGQLLSIAQNTALFSLLGTTYGGNGQTTFALPDLRGRSPIGFGQGPGLSPIDLGEFAGTESVTLLGSNVPSFTAPLNGTASVAIPANTSEGSSQTPATGSVLSTTLDSTAGAEVKLYSDGPGTTTLQPFNAHITGTATYANSPIPVAIRNPYLGVNFIIALEGIFPSRN